MIKNELPPEGRTLFLPKSEYERNGALQYLAAWDAPRGIVLRRGEKKTGIQPIGWLVDQAVHKGVGSLFDGNKATPLFSPQGDGSASASSRQGSA